MIRFTLRLPQQQMEDLKALARKHGISFSALVREAVDDYLDEADSAVKQENASRSRSRVSQEVNA